MLIKANNFYKNIKKKKKKNLVNFFFELIGRNT